MAKAMKYRDLEKLLVAAGATWRQGGKGSHIQWYCGCGRHSVSVPAGHGAISPAIVRETTKKLLNCQKEG